MNQNRKVTRRDLLKLSAGAAGILASSSALARTIGAACKLTPPQTEGPFYPVNDQLDKDSDLTSVEGRPGRARGELIYVRGVVRDEACAPIAGAWVEIWQACASGRYNHPGDTNPAPLDPDFQYWGRGVTGEDGSYLFKTILPGAYPASDTWTRPPHIHFKVGKRGFHELTTQMYFAGQELNATDEILRKVPASQRSSVVIEAQDPPAEFDPSSKLYSFDLTLLRP